MTETRTLNEFRDKFRVEDLKVLENSSWTWSVRPGQPTLGSGILSLNRHAGKFSEVSEEELKDLAELVAAIEGTIMVDHHVHYHVIPRYEGIRTFAGREWVDNGWPALPVIADAQHADDPKLLHHIQEELRPVIV